MTKKQKKMLSRIIIASILMVILAFIPITGLYRFLLYMMPYLIIGYDILKKAILGIINRQVFDENFLMAVATIGAIILAVSGSGDYIEAVAVMLFYQIGELFQSYAVGKSRRNISELMDIRPDYANMEIDGKLEKCDPDEIAIGSIIIVQPGEKIPLDGIVIEGSSTLDTSALTGESVPRNIHVNEEVISGCINMTGVLKIRTTKEFGESTVSKILELVENASSKKSRSENFISKFAKIYTPAVCYSALALAVLPPLLCMLMGFTPNFGNWLYRALTFLVMSCPCALVISIPLTFFAGIGGAGKAGVLIKGSNYLETLSKTDTIVFDKTGTLTEGAFTVTAIQPINYSKEQLIEYAAHAESASSHPISQSIATAYNKDIDRSRVSDIQEISGKGILAKVDNETVAIGNKKLMVQLNIDFKEPSETGTILHMAVNNTYAGYILIADVIKPTTKTAIAKLKSLGIKKTVMLTGDTSSVANVVAKKLGIDEVHSELLPGNKVSIMEQLLDNKKGKGTIAFAGDGINDAPVLSRADIGIAMGAMGSDAAIEAADIVLMDDDPVKIALAIQISRKSLRIVHQNIVFALGIKLICLLLGALGIANMWLAIFADVGVMVIAVLNAIRALYIKQV